MKYSKAFERDYNFYINNLDNFDFCGTVQSRYEGYLSDGKNYSAKECFYMIESGIPIGNIRLDKFKKTIKIIPCNEPELLNKLLLTKAGVNFQIKQWAEGIADGTLLLFEYSQRLFNERQKLLGDYPPIDGSFNLVLENSEVAYYKDIETQYGCPEWVGMAILNQGKKIHRDKLLADVE